MLRVQHGSYRVVSPPSGFSGFSEGWQMPHSPYGALLVLINPIEPLTVLPLVQSSTRSMLRHRRSCKRAFCYCEALKSAAGFPSSFLGIVCFKRMRGRARTPLSVLGKVHLIDMKNWSERIFHILQRACLQICPPVARSTEQHQTSAPRHLENTNAMLSKPVT